MKLRKVRWIKVVAVAIVLLSLALAIDIYRFSFTRDRTPSDAAIVLGAAVWNEKPSPVFAERIKHAIDLYKTKQVKFLVFTGGVGDGDRFAESTVAAQYAIQNGVKPQAMFCEKTSKITLENLQEAKAILQRHQIEHSAAQNYRVSIVSDPLHMRRSVLMARDLGIDAYSSPTPTTKYMGLQSQFEFLSRETFFYGLHLVQRPFLAPAPTRLAKDNQC